MVHLANIFPMAQSQIITVADANFVDEAWKDKVKLSH